MNQSSERLIKSTGKCDPIENGEKSNGKTFWRNVIMATLVNLLAAIELPIFNNAQWIYLKSFDPNVSPTFLGQIISMNKGAHALFAVLFGALAVRYGRIRPLIITGRLLTLLACLLFLEADRIRDWHKPLICSASVLIGIADGSVMLFRGYVTASSQTRDRALAFAAIALANVVSVILGASTSMVFSLITYPDMNIAGFRLTKFSAPMIVVIFCNIAAISITYFGVKERQQNTENNDYEMESSCDNSSTKGRTSMSWKSFPTFLVLLCFFEQIVTSTSISTTTIITSPMTTEVFAFDSTATLQLITTTHAITGLLALTTVIIFMAFKVGNRIASWKIFAVCLVMFFVFFVTVYPHQVISHPILIKTDNETLGCDPAVYEWCSDTHRPPVHLYFTLLAFTFGIFFPLANISLDTTYSKILGNIDQSFLQSAIIAFDDVFQIMCPNIATHLFKWAGHPRVFAICAGLTAIGAGVWLTSFGAISRRCTTTDTDHSEGTEMRRQETKSTLLEYEEC